MKKKISRVIENHLTDIGKMEELFNSSMNLIFSIQDGKLLKADSNKVEGIYHYNLIYKTSQGLIIDTILKWCDCEDKYKVEKISLRK